MFVPFTCAANWSFYCLSLWNSWKGRSFRLRMKIFQTEKEDLSGWKKKKKKGLALQWPRGVREDGKSQPLTPVRQRTRVHLTISIHFPRQAFEGLIFPLAYTSAVRYCAWWNVRLGLPITRTCWIIARCNQVDSLDTGRNPLDTIVHWTSRSHIHMGGPTRHGRSRELYFKEQDSFMETVIWRTRNLRRRSVASNWNI